MRAPSSLDEVHRTILDRILTGYYPAGTKLPSCRALAAELGSNSSTVDRAIGRLAGEGRVRTVPRRGSFVEREGAAVVDAHSVVRAEMDDVLLRARRLGFTAADLAGMVRDCLARVDAMRRIAVVECNERDLRALQHMVQQANGVEVQPVLLDDAVGHRLDEEFDAVACPVFHLNDLAEVVTSFDAVIELPLVASKTALRRLIALRDQPEVVVVAPTERGVRWMIALAGQYFPGEIRGIHQATDNLASYRDARILVVNNAACLPDGIEEHVDHIVPIEWELDGRFTQTLRSQIDHAIGAGSVMAKE